MKKIIFGTLFSIILLAGGYFIYARYFRPLAPALLPPSQDIVKLLEKKDAPAGDPRPAGQNNTDMPLKLPDGFSISIFAQNLSGARVLLPDAGGNFWVSRPSSGAVTFLEVKRGKVSAQNNIFQNLKGPHGLAFDPDDPNILYIAEENKVSKALLGTEAPLQKIADLPSGAGHSTRTLLFGKDNRLYVSIGSSCNVCVEKDARRAAVYSMNKDGSDFREFAEGLRNSVFMINNPKTGEIWATDMGRDLLGDNVPPEEINILKDDQNYGWPYCYANNIHDDNFDPNRAVSCEGKIPPHISFQAHSAPLGLAFIPQDSSWPAEYRGDLLVAFHGSWNRSVPTGYKIVRFDLDENGNATGPSQDFISGWLQGSNALGRPVDLKFAPDGALYVSDDKAGVIYRVTY
jgi:glucose/arabinose dehydrogenase